MDIVSGTGAEIAIRLMNTVFDSNYLRRREWFCWAAKPQKCPKCDAEPNYPCKNLTVWRKHAKVVPTTSPHSERVDWYRLVDGLAQRGYISGDVLEATLTRMRKADHGG
jgi:hypothetical protein